MPTWIVNLKDRMSCVIEAARLVQRDQSLFFMESSAVDADTLAAFSAGTWESCWRQDMLPQKTYDDPFNRPVPPNPDER